MVTRTERERARDLIQTYCRRGGRDGGIMMVCGPRGVGKTHLVDEVLCLQSDSGPFQHLIGDHTGRLRLRANREPRFMDRFLVKVEVDPYFPQNIDQSTEQVNLMTATEDVRGRRQSYGRRKTDVTNVRDTNTHAYQMLRNLVFGLTSTLDPQSSRRRHGKTLRDKLGWTRYWWAGNALWWPGDNGNKKWPIRSWLITATITSLLVTLFTGVGDLLVRICLFFLLLIISLMGSWILLRWLDWQSVKCVTRRLYSLIHAQDVDVREDSKSVRTWELKQRWSLLIGLGLVLLVLGTELAPEIMAMVTLDKGSMATLATSDATDLIKWLSFSLGAGLLLFTRMSRYEIHHVSRYGQQNPVWMVSLLRRYLFLLHRCGIEPVLVFDELDKLEQPFGLGDSRQGNRDLTSEFNFSAKAGTAFGVDDPKGDYQAESPHKDRREGSRERNVERRRQISLSAFPTMDKLEQFLNAMLRLRQSVGADFLSILIGGPRLYEVLYNHRWQKATGSDVLGTFIQYDVYLGPSHPSESRGVCSTLNCISHGNKGDVVSALDHVFGCLFPRIATGNREQASELKEDMLKWIWVESSGLLSNIQRLLAEHTQRLLAEQPRPVGVDYSTAGFIFDQVAHLWEVQNLSEELRSHGMTAKTDAQGTTAMLADPWRILWLRTGFARMSWELNRLADQPIDSRDLFCELAGLLGEDPEAFRKMPGQEFTLIGRALPRTEHPILVQLGRVLLFSHMYWFYMEHDRKKGGIRPPAETGYKLCIELPGS